MRHTKIVATIGPASDSPESIRQMLDAGVDVIRFNMKHGTLDWHNQRLKLVEDICQDIGSRVATLIDLQGPEVRLHHVPDELSQIKPGQKLRFGKPGSKNSLELDHPGIFSELNPDQIIYADDGFLEFRITKTNPNWFEAEVIEGGMVKPRKTVNFPGFNLNLPALIDRDLEHLSLTTKHHIDFVALSYVRDRQDIDTLRQQLRQHKVECQIIAKIEHPLAVENLADIIDASDGIMVARGDLGLEFPLEEVPALQKKIVAQTRQHSKPVIIATQMLESMITQPRPTRAEVSDVAGAVYESTDAIMLSGESAAGKHPIRAIKTMDRIARRVEQTRTPPPALIEQDQSPDQTAAIVNASLALSQQSPDTDQFKAFVVLTETGRTVRQLSRLRPNLPIIALSTNHKTVDQLKLSWGVKPLHYDYTTQKPIDPLILTEFLKTQNLLNPGNKVIMIYGEQWGTPGLTSVIRIQEA